MVCGQFDLRGARQRDWTVGAVQGVCALEKCGEEEGNVGVAAAVKPMDVWFVNPCVPVVTTPEPIARLPVDVLVSFFTSCFIPEFHGALN